MGGLRGTLTEDGEIVVDEVADDEVEPVVEEEEVDEGYVLEDEDEAYEEEEEDEESPLGTSGEDDY